MKNSVTTPDSASDGASITREHQQTSRLLLLVTTLWLLVTAALQFWSGYIWPDDTARLFLLLSSALLVSGLSLQLRDAPDRINLPATDYPQDELFSQISWQALRPNHAGALRNCTISKHSDDHQLTFKPVMSLQYSSAFLASLVVLCLSANLLSSMKPNWINAGFLTTTDPTYRTLLFLLGTLTLCCVSCLLRKSARALFFNKNLGVFWIEKYRVFSWKIGESAQMPIAQVAALQIIQYSKQRQLRHTLQAQDNLSQIKTQHGCGKEYEINVVFRSGNRVNIISHRNRRAILEDCSALAAFLDVPIWHKNQ